MNFWKQTAQFGWAVVFWHITATGTLAADPIKPGRTPKLMARPLRHLPWGAGQVVTHTGQIIDGDLNFNWRANVVQLRQADGILKAYSTQQIAQFRYFDGQVNNLRRFVAVHTPPVALAGRGQLRPLFLEEVISGPLTVYRRLRQQRGLFPVRNPRYFSDAGTGRNYDAFDYYVVTNGAGLPLRQFSFAEWPRLQREFHAQFRQYTQSRSVNFGSTVGQLMLITHYNFLKQQTIVSQAQPAAERSVTGE